MVINIPSITIGGAVVTVSAKLVGHLATLAGNRAKAYVEVARHLPGPEVESRLLALRAHPSEIKATIAAVRALAQDMESAALILEGKEAEGGELAEAAARIGRGYGEDRLRTTARLREVAGMLRLDISRAAKRMAALDRLHSIAATAALATGKVDASKIVGKFRIPPSIVDAGAGPAGVQARARDYIRKLTED